MVRDSAGIRIVENVAPAFSRADQWRLESDSFLQISSGDGDSIPILYGVHDLTVLSDGRIVMINGAVQELLYYSPDGAFLTAVGGQGEGPGEFEGLYRVTALEGDTVMASDVRTGRQTFFGPDGALVRTVTVQVEGSSPGQPLGRLSDGSILMRRGRTQFNDDPNMRTQTLREPGWIARLTSDGMIADTLLEFVSGESFVLNEGGYRSVGSKPFGRRSFEVLVGDTVVTVWNGGWDVWLHPADGAPPIIARKIIEPIPLSDREIESYRSRAIERASASRREQTRLRVNAMDFHSTHPTLEAMVPDTDGYVWLKINTPGADPLAPATWSVIGLDGRWITEITTPAGFELMHVGRDRATGIWRDEFRAEHIRQYRIVKP